MPDTTPVLIYALIPVTAFHTICGHSVRVVEKGTRLENEYFEGYAENDKRRCDSCLTKQARKTAEKEKELKEGEKAWIAKDVGGGV
jgi:hypothetical protein